MNDSKLSRDRKTSQSSEFGRLSRTSSKTNLFNIDADMLNNTIDIDFSSYEKEPSVLSKAISEPKVIIQNIKKPDLSKDNINEQNNNLKYIPPRPSPVQRQAAIKNSTENTTATSLTPIPKHMFSDWSYLLEAVPTAVNDLSPKPAEGSRQSLEYKPINSKEFLNKTLEDKV